jgi:hypothetical protein
MEGIKMADIPKDMRFLLFGPGAKWMARESLAYNCLGIVFLILGIVGDATNMTLGLETSHWFIMAIAFWLWGFWAWLTAYKAAKEG